MRKYIIIIMAMILITACEEANEAETHSDEMDTTKNIDENLIDEDDEYDADVQTYQNDAFQEVTVRKTGADSYLVKGKARVFEATIHWVVEDGHNELKTGYTTASEGAPGWGNFEFTVKVQKQEPNTNLMLILFEESAKDGSRQHELVIPLREATPV